MNIHTFTLPNGIRFVHCYHTSPVAYCGLSINAGSRDEKAAENGMAHLAEHMLFKGTTRRSAYHINNRLENVGGELNAFTTKEETVVHAIVLKSDLDKAVELLADIVFRSTFPDRELAKEKEVIADEINSYLDNPSELIFDDFDKWLFAGSSLGRPILGTPDSLADITAAQLKTFVSRHYRPSQLVFSTVASVNAKRMEQLAVKYFSEFPAAGVRRERKAPSVCRPFQKILRRNTFQEHCIIGNRAYSLHDPRRTGLALLVNYLGGPAANSRLNSLLREKNGLVYTTDATYMPYDDCGTVTLYFAADRVSLNRCAELVQKELTAICTNAFGTAQLHRIKKQWLGQLFINADNAEVQMLSNGKNVMSYGYVESFEQLKAKIDALTAAELLDIANEIFAPERLSTLIYTS
ncbi:MAG: insulinase family protein [Prevotellaceae bacterium]|nr:insulinase family protein [Prevotellaceae bacterium]